MKNLFLTILLFVHIQTLNLRVPEQEVTEISIKIKKTFELLKSFEKFEPRPYKLGVYNYIGYGHLILSSEDFTFITEKKASEILKDDYKKKYQFMRKSLPGININYVHLCTLLAFNIGEGEVVNTRFFRAVKSNKKISKLYKNFCYFEGKKHKGLLSRRVQELKIWLK